MGGESRPLEVLNACVQIFDGMLSQQKLSPRQLAQQRVRLSLLPTVFLSHVWAALMPHHQSHADCVMLVFFLAHPPLWCSASRARWAAQLGRAAWPARGVDDLARDCMAAAPPWLPRMQPAVASRLGRSPLSSAFCGAAPAREDLSAGWQCGWADGVGVVHIRCMLRCSVNLTEKIPVRCPGYDVHVLSLYSSVF